MKKTLLIILSIVLSIEGMNKSGTVPINVERKSSRRRIYRGQSAPTTPIIQSPRGTPPRRSMEKRVSWDSSCFTASGVNSTSRPQGPAPNPMTILIQRQEEANKKQEETNILLKQLVALQSRQMVAAERQAFAVERQESLIKQLVALAIENDNIARSLNEEMKDISLVNIMQLFCDTDIIDETLSQEKEIKERVQSFGASLTDQIQLKILQILRKKMNASTGSQGSSV